MSGPSRRATLCAAVVAGSGMLIGDAAAAAPRHDPGPYDAEQAAASLRRGNRRWRTGAAAHPHTGAGRREELVDGQQPFALILGCADSRVPPERVFDRGLGDVFTVRSAGQVLDSAVMGSLTYAVRHLATPLLVVLGHSSCGAVSAAIEAHRSGTVPDGHVGALVRPLLPVVAATPDGGGDHVDACVRANARDIARRLRGDSELGRYVADGALQVTAARYDLADGGVEFLDG